MRIVGAFFSNVVSSVKPLSKSVTGEREAAVTLMHWDQSIKEHPGQMMSTPTSWSWASFPVTIFSVETEILG